MCPTNTFWRLLVRQRLNNKNPTTKSFTSGLDTRIIPLDESKRFIRECVEAVGTPRDHAKALADLLVEADYRGHYSHGMNRLEMYVKDIQAKSCDGAVKPEILKESPATAWVDGKNGLGVVVGNFCMDVAIKKAKEVGVGWVCAKGSNHYGIAAWYPMQAIKHGLIGMSFTNTSPLMCPTRSKVAALGTNPISAGARAKGDDSFLLDLATTAVAVGKIEIAKRKNQPIPEGWAQDTNGNITTNADIAYKSGCLMPLGGTEINSGYKGSGLGLLVEVFCGILGGAAFGSNIRRWGSTDKKADLGQCFVAIDPKRFAPGFETRLSEIMDNIRKMEPIDPKKPVMIAGDPEKNHMKLVDKNGGVRYVKNQMDSCKRLSEELKVKPLKSL